jgi:hypothetical protein
VETIKILISFASSSSCVDLVLSLRQSMFNISSPMNGVQKFTLQIELRFPTHCLRKLCNAIASGLGMATACM